MIARRVALAVWASSLVLCALFSSRSADAAGVRAVNSRIEENTDTKSWKLKLKIDHGSVPDRDMVTMVFSFKQLSLYDRELTDESPEKPRQVTTPVPNPVPNISEQEVGFSDSATGKRYAVTEFPITLRRKSDFEAGEYELTIKIPGGRTIGTVKIQLVGENKVIDRRSLQFAGNVGGGKKAAVAKPPGDDSSDKKGPVAAEDMGPDLSNIPDTPGSSKKATPVETPPGEGPKQGGCGCRVVGEPSDSRSWALCLLGFALLTARRRR
jgi:MYXO-CTERM domain-containing protein